MDSTWSERLRACFIFVLLSLTVIFARLLPITDDPGRLPGPDLLMVLTIAWVIRRPDELPVLLIAGVFLSADLLLMRPPGLTTAIIILAVEFLGSRRAQTRGAPFVIEWLIGGVVMFGSVLLNQAILAALAAGAPRFGLVFFSALTSIAAYPLVVVLLRYGFGLGRIDDEQTARIRGAP